MMLDEQLCVAAKKTLLFSGASGALGVLGASVGELICDMSVWDNVQLIQLLVAGGVGNALLGIPAGACSAICNSTRRADLNDGTIERKSLVWTSITGGLGSLAGASLLCMVDSNEKGTSALSVGMVGGAAIGVCALCVGGIYFAVTACRSGYLTFSRLSVSEPTESIDSLSPRAPLLQGIEEIDAGHALAQQPLPSIAEASRAIEARLGVPVEDVVIAIEAPEDEENVLIDVDLNSPPLSPTALEPERTSKCSIM